MSDSAEDTRPSPGAQDDIPVDDLIRLTREFTRRITNQDRQRLALDLRASGHQRSIQTAAPIPLQQFFSGEIDLDSELADRFLHAPLMAHVRFTARPGTPLHHQATAVFSCQDDSMLMSIDAPPVQGVFVQPAGSTLPEKYSSSASVKRSAPSPIAGSITQSPDPRLKSAALVSESSVAKAGVVKLAGGLAPSGETALLLAASLEVTR